MATMVKITALTRNNVCSVSVQTMVLIPPRKVYTQIKVMVTTTVKANGILKASKNAICNTTATKYNRNAAPINLEIKKKKEPVLYDLIPNLCSR